MKKKRSIQKLRVHKKTISNLNTVTGGEFTTKYIKSAVFGSCNTCNSCNYTNCGYVCNGDI